MNVRNRSIFILMTLLSLSLFANEREVISTWVPPYSLETCKENLMDSSLKMGDVLDRLGLLFWIPTCELTETDTTITGKLELEYDLDSNDVVWFREWTREHEVELLLCVGFIMVPDSEFTEANLAINSKLEKIAFHDNGDTLIRSLLDEMDKYDLDGIGLDFEHLVGYREEYAQFVQTIADSVHSRGKTLSVCVAPSTQWSGVNTTWWEDYVGYADELLIMGYFEVYAGQNNKHGGNIPNNYRAILDFGLDLGYKPEQLALGMPAWMNDWGHGGRGTSTLDHLLELRDLDTTVSVTLCDARLVGNSWKDSLTWQTLKLVNEPPKIVLSDIDGSTMLTDEDTLTISWTLPEETVHHSKVISVRAFDSTKYAGYGIDTSKYQWRVVDTIPSEKESFVLDLSAIEDTLFTVMVALMDESGAVIDYDLTGTYFELEQTTAIATPLTEKSQLCQIQSLNNGVLNLNHNFSSEHQLTITDLRGRELFRKAVTPGTGSTAIALPVARGIYLAQISGAQFNGAWKLQMQ